MLVQNEKSMRATICTNFERYMNGEITEKQFNATMKVAAAFTKVTMLTHVRVKSECMLVETNKKYGSDVSLNILDTKVVD